MLSAPRSVDDRTSIRTRTRSRRLTQNISAASVSMLAKTRMLLDGGQVQQAVEVCAQGRQAAAASYDLAEALSDEQQAQLSAIERLVMFYFPRICNHCINPACVASCPSGALYKRGEDGIVLIDQKVCRAWRSCVAACPYKKTYFNWQTGKSEKCILCFPRVETGQAPACFHSCVGRIRYLGVLLYDADRIQDVATKDDSELVEAHRSMILDPHDPAVLEAAQRNGMSGMAAL